MDMCLSIGYIGHRKQAHHELMLVLNNVIDFEYLSFYIFIYK